jgi:hypothetical protein
MGVVAQSARAPPAGTRTDAARPAPLTLRIVQRACEQARPPALPGYRTDSQPLLRRERSPADPADSGDLAPPLVHQVLAQSGEPLESAARSGLEAVLGHDFSQVRVHDDPLADRSARQVGANAYTVGRHIVFRSGRYRPGSLEGSRLIAHELMHTVQQAHASPSAALRIGPVDDAHEHAAQQAARAVRATAPPRPPVLAPAPRARARVSTAPAPAVQRQTVQRDAADAGRQHSSGILGKIADKANVIPGFRLLTLVLGVNPITMSAVERSAANVLRALIEFIPGGGLVVQALDNSGVFDKVAAWIDQQLTALALTAASIKQAVTDFISPLGVSDVFDLGGVWERAKKIFTEPIGRIIDFAKGCVTGILQFIRDAILLPLARLAEGTRGWDLLIAVLGKNPITGEPVAPSAENLIGGFLKLIGEDEVWENMKKAKAIDRAWSWFQGAARALTGFVAQIPDLFVAAFKALTLPDVVLVAGAFQKVAGVFGGFLAKFIDWAGTALWNLLEIIFEVVSPGALMYVKKTGEAFKGILKNPLPFAGNLVKAAKLGFENFAAHFGTHLKEGLIDWLTGSLPDVYIPKALTLVEFGKFALSVLGISWAQIRAKIIKALGPNGEKMMTALETGFELVATLITGGAAAAWDLIKERLTNLKDILVDGIKSFVLETIVQKAVPKLISLFVPGAGFLSAILSIYGTIKVFIEKLAKIAAAVKAFIDSIVAIAEGRIEGAAQKIEGTLAGLLSLAINLLAGFLNLGDIAAKVLAVIQRVRAAVDKALDAAANWIVSKAKAFLAKAKDVAAKLFNWAVTKTTFPDEKGATHTVSVEGAPPRLTIASTPQPARAFLDTFKRSQSPDYLEKNKDKIAAVETAITQADATIKQIDAAVQAGKDPGSLTALQRDLLNSNVTVSTALKALVGKDPLAGETRQHFLLEGVTGTYASIPKPTSDDLTPDHQPQAAILQLAATYTCFSPKGRLATLAANRAQEGYAINLSTTRHKAGETFGYKGKNTKADFSARVGALPRNLSAADQRKVVVKEIRADLDRDVAAMIRIGSTNAKSHKEYWTDVLPKGKAEDRDPVIADIGKRIVAGENQVKAQDIESLANE